jgi:hypothetical protein
MQQRVAVLAVLVLPWWLPAPAAAEPATRHGVSSNLKNFPQATPKEALASALKAVDLKRVDYLLAHLVDTEWVDRRADLYQGGFPELVRESTAKLDGPSVKQLQRFLSEGEFETLDASAVVRLPKTPDRVVRLRKVGERWFLRNLSKP